MTKNMSEEQLEQPKMLNSLTVEQFLKAVERIEKYPEVARIEKNFNVAFANLSDKAKNVVTKKELSIGLEDYEGRLYAIITQEGKFLTQLIFDDIIGVYTLKNRFVIKETDSDLYLVAPRHAVIKGMSAVGAIETVSKLKKDKVLYCSILDENKEPILYQLVCNNLKKVTKLSNNVYLVQENDFLIAVTTGMVVDSMNTEEVEMESEDYRSYV